jgi:hypothetical protein
VPRAVTEVRALALKFQRVLIFLIKQDMFSLKMGI